MQELHVASCVHGYHVYGETWTASLGEELCCERELGNVIDRYAVAVKKIQAKLLATCRKRYHECAACLSKEEGKLQLQ